MSSSHKDSSKNQYSNFEVAGPALVGLSIELRIVLWEFQGRGQPPEFRSSREGAGWLRGSRCAAARRKGANAF